MAKVITGLFQKLYNNVELEGGYRCNIHYLSVVMYDTSIDFELEVDVYIPETYNIRINFSVFENLLIDYVRGIGRYIALDNRTINIKYKLKDESISNYESDYSDQ